MHLVGLWSLFKRVSLFPVLRSNYRLGILSDFYTFQLRTNYRQTESIVMLPQVSPTGDKLFLQPTESEGTYFSKILTLINQSSGVSTWRSRVGVFLPLVISARHHSVVWATSYMMLMMHIAVLLVKLIKRLEKKKSLNMRHVDDAFWAIKSEHGEDFVNWPNTRCNAHEFLMKKEISGRNTNFCDLCLQASKSETFNIVSHKKRHTGRGSQTCILPPAATCTKRELIRPTRSRTWKVCNERKNAWSWRAVFEHIVLG